MQRDNNETMQQIEDDAKEEQKEILAKNNAAREQVEYMSFQSKAELQITKNKLTDVQSDVKTLNRQIIDRQISLQKQTEIKDKLQLEWTQKKAEIEQKDSKIH